MLRRRVWAVFLAAIAIAPSPARGEAPPPYQSDFPPEEFQARWKAIFDRIGHRAVAILQGAPKARGFLVPRQYNEFYYLCGVETPHAYLILDGRDRKVTLVLPPRDSRLERAEGKVVSAEDAEAVKRLTGVDTVLRLDVVAGEDGVRRRPYPMLPARGRVH